MYRFAPFQSAEFIDSSRNGDQAPLLGRFWDIITVGDEPIVGLNGVFGSDIPSDGTTFQCESGGTTGTPKRIRRTVNSWLASIRIISAEYAHSVGCYGILGDLGHSLAFYAAIEAQITGLRLVTVAGRSPKEQAQELAREGVDLIYATPTQLRLLAKSKQILNLVRVILIGGGRLDAATRAQVLGLAPNAMIYQFYGAAETSFVTLANPDHDPSSVGVAFPGVELDIRNAGPDGIGDVWVRSPYLFQGYTQGNVGDTEWNDGWLTVGELGRLDETGQLFLIGRKSRVFTVADKNIYPEDIEAHLLSNPDVLAAAVFALDDPLRGARTCVALCSDEMSETRSRDIIDDLRSTGLAVDRWRKFGQSDWPILVSGKPNYRKLRETVLGETWQK